MLKKRIIPCLDVKDGRVVKGINFIDLVDAGDPVEQAKFYSENGADEICFLDISASLEERDTMLSVLKKTAEEVFIPLTVGGGIKSINNIKDSLMAGADKKPNDIDGLQMNFEYFHTVEVASMFILYELIHRIGASCPSIRKENLRNVNSSLREYNSK